jgi:hypothetical protein
MHLGAAMLWLAAPGVDIVERITATLTALTQSPHSPARDIVTLVLSRQFIADALDDFAALEQELVSCL